jgi:hypothetical protein
MQFFRAIGVLLEIFFRPLRALLFPKPPILGLEAEYADGLTFQGVNGTFFRVEWNRADAGSSPCPLSAFPDEVGEIDPATLESPDALRRLGITLEDPTDDFPYASFNTDDYIIEATYKNGSLWVVYFQVWPKATKSLEVAVNGRRFRLPVTKETLFETLGSPIDFDERMVRQR